MFHTLEHTEIKVLSTIINSFNCKKSLFLSQKLTRLTDPVQSRESQLLCHLKCSDILTGDNLAGNLESYLHDLYRVSEHHLGSTSLQYRDITA